AFPQLEFSAHASTWTSTSRAGEALQDSTTGPLLGSSLGLHIVWRPDMAQSEAVSAGLVRMRIWGVDDNTKVEIEADRRLVHVVVDGVDATLPGKLPAWAADSLFVLDLAGIGNGAPSGTYAYDGGAAVSLGEGPALPTLRTAAALITWFASAPS